MSTVVAGPIERVEPPAPRTPGVQPAWVGRAVVVGCGVVMLLVGWWGLDRGSMWQDESATFEVAHRSIREIVAVLGQVDVVHGLYYLLVHVWMAPGGGEVWMRVPSVLAMAVVAGAVAALGLRLAGARVGLVAGLLFAASPLLSFYAQEGRSTALVTAAVLLATVCLTRAVDGPAPTTRWWLGYAAAMAFAVLLHEFAVLALAAHGTTLLLNRARRVSWARWLGIAGGCALLVVPIVVLSSEQAGQVAWLERPTRHTLTVLEHQLCGSSPALVLATVLLAAVGVLAELRSRRAVPTDERRWSLVSVALPLLVLPPAVLLTASLVQPLFHVRYVLYAAAGVPLLVARGLDAVAAAAVRTTRRAWAGAVLATVVVLALVATQVPQLLFVRTVASRPNDLAAAAAVIGRNSRPGDAVVFMPMRYRAAALAYPADFTRVHDIALARTGTQADNLRGIDRSRRAVRRAMLAQQRIWVVGRTDLRVAGPPGEPGAVNEKAVLDEAFVKVAAYPVHGMQVALYERRES